MRTGEFSDGSHEGCGGNSLRMGARSVCAYTKGLDKPVGMECAEACAKNGSPRVILREDGTIFLPIDDKTPAYSMNARLMPFAGERVTVVGKDYVRNGSHGLIIEKIPRCSDRAKGKGPVLGLCKIANTLAEV